MNAYSEKDTFKLYMSDVGLLRSLSNIDYREILLDRNILFKGALTENYVTEELFSKNREIFYFRFNRFVVDFLIKLSGDVIPIEVKW